MSGRRPTRKKWLRLDFLFFLVQILVLFRPTTFFLGIPTGRTILVSCFFFSVPLTQKIGSTFGGDGGET